MWVLMQIILTNFAKIISSTIHDKEEIWSAKITTLQKIHTVSDSNILELERKIDSITNGLSRPYFNKILKELVKKNLENAIIICDYIIAEQIEINIKNSTKESKIKILVWLSNYFQDKKSFKDMTKHDILDFLNKLRKSSSRRSCTVNGLDQLQWKTNNFKQIL